MAEEKVLSRGKLFDPTLVRDLISKVQGFSSLATLCAQTPIPFNGQKEFVFTMSDEVDLVAENGKKTAGSIDVQPRVIVPLKFEYGARISDEFLYASEAEQIEILKAYNDGFAKKVARGLDICSMHGVNPRSKTASSLIGDNHFDNGVTVITASDGENANDLVEKAIAAIMGKDYEADGIAMSPQFRSDLAAVTYADGRKMFPELTWGHMAGNLNGLTASSNNTVSFNESPDSAIVGDFKNAFKWGFAKQIPVEVIRYGDPDNSGNDLKGYNQVYIRAEVYIGWGILDKNAFAVIQAAGLKTASLAAAEPVATAKK